MKHSKKNLEKKIATIKKKNVLIEEVNVELSVLNSLLLVELDKTKEKIMHEKDYIGSK